MRLDHLSLLRCPNCKSPDALEIVIEKGDDRVVTEGQLLCPNCGSTFPVKDGIPHMLPSNLLARDSDQGKTLSEEQKMAQIAHFDSIGASEIEVNRPHGFGKALNFLLDTKFETVTHLWGEPVAESIVLDLCCGSGMDAEYLANAGANVVGVDISIGALRGAQERARRYGLEYDLVLGDAENLPVRDRAFQLAYVHDGLHHLNSPEKGFSEMARVASEGILVTEPAKTLLTEVAIRLGIADIREESGNLVHRFSESELRFFCDQAMLQMPKLNRYLMYYRQRPFQFFQLLENRLLFSIFVILYMVTNLLFGRWGNKIALVARR
jgi:ubiquinone/menaquinone biosynthesis C-methylase UbiE/uncharacterized protein YbaR (Trm112 family)